MLRRENSQEEENIRSVFMEMEYSKSIKDTVNIFVVFEENIFQSQNHQNTLIVKKRTATLDLQSLYD